jgi:hypothetical protein
VQIGVSDGLFALGALLFVGASVVQMVLLPRSLRYRTDLRPGQSVGQGRSFFWQMNVMDPRHYDSDEGRRFHRKMLTFTGIQLLGGLLIGMGVVVTDTFG